MTTEQRIDRLTQSVRAAFENELLSVVESRGVYYVARQRDHDHPHAVRILRAIGTVGQKMHDLKRQIKEYADECEG